MTLSRSFLAERTDQVGILVDVSIEATMQQHERSASAAISLVVDVGIVSAPIGRWPARVLSIRVDG
jgi:hypothetical protein